MPEQALVGLIMGSKSDWETLQHCGAMLDQLKIPYKARVLSAHRTPDLLFEYVSSAESRGLEVIIAGAGGAAHLAGIAAAKTLLPVLGVPMESKSLNGMDSLLSMVQDAGGDSRRNACDRESGSNKRSLVRCGDHVRKASGVSRSNQAVS